MSTPDVAGLPEDVAELAARAWRLRVVLGADRIATMPKGVRWVMHPLTWSAVRAAVPPTSAIVGMVEKGPEVGAGTLFGIVVAPDADRGRDELLLVIPA